MINEYFKAADLVFTPAQEPLNLPDVDEGELLIVLFQAGAVYAAYVEPALQLLPFFYKVDNKGIPGIHLQALCRLCGDENIPRHFPFGQRQPLAPLDVLVHKPPVKVLPYSF